MLKYTESQVVFREIPDEITLALNISRCPCHCPGCHSSYLAEDVGNILNTESLNRELIYAMNDDITCVSFMGGDADPGMVDSLAAWIRRNWPDQLKIAWYSGRQELASQICLDNFDYIKLGPYIEELGPLDNPKTNQRLYMIDHQSDNKMIDITNKFWSDTINFPHN